jgi:lipid A 3-O-deacylase
MTKIRLLIFLSLLNTFKSFSQKEDSLILPKKLENYFSFNYDNDFFSATDRYYTQGILLSFIHPIVRYSPFTHALIKLDKSAVNYYGLHLQQDVFTPISIRHEGIFYGERPFSAVLFISHNLTSMVSSKKILLQTQIDLGVLGPYAKGEEEQKGIHKALNNIQPLGWENQIANDAIINYKLKFEKGVLSKKHLELIGSSGLRFGTLYTDLSLGLHARWGIFNPYFNGLGSENQAKYRNYKFKLYGVTKINTKLVAYNATLQGGLINQSSVYTLSGNDIARGVLDFMIGVVIAYNRVSVEYGKFYITPEFKHGVNHGWGRCVITVCF